MYSSISGKYLQKMEIIHLLSFNKEFEHLRFYFKVLFFIFLMVSKWIVATGRASILQLFAFHLLLFFRSKFAGNSISDREVYTPFSHCVQHSLWLAVWQINQSWKLISNITRKRTLRYFRTKRMLRPVGIGVNLGVIL